MLEAGQEDRGKARLVGEETADNPLQDDGSSSIIEPRANPNRDPKTGRLASGKGGAKSVGNSVGAPSMSAKERARVSHQIATDMPELKADGTVYSCFNRKHFFTFTVWETGTYNFDRKIKIKIEGNEKRI